jgi:ankyrin repeat protein
VDPIASFVAAVHQGDAVSAADLLKKHSDLKRRLNDPLPGFYFGGTALLAAVGRGDRAMIDLLLANGADVNRRSDWWAGSFGVLDSEGDLAPYLIERGAIVDAHAAARLGALDRLEALVRKDPDVVYAKGGDGQTPLHFARSVDVARFLLSKGARIDALCVDHESTPAMYMVKERQDVARFLVARGCRTDMLMAAALGDLALVRRQLEREPMSIHTAVSATYFPMRDKRAGGTIYIWTLGRYKTAYAVAGDFGHEDVFSLLMERTSAERKLALACEAGDEASVRAILGAEPDIARRLSEHEKIRIAAMAENNNTAAVRLMLEAGWPTSARGENEGTALHWAAWHGNIEMTREILSRKPALEIKDGHFGGTPLDWAMHGSLNSWHRDTGDHVAVVLALLQAGAKAPEITPGSEPSTAVLEVLKNPPK